MSADKPVIAVVVGHGPTRDKGAWSQNGAIHELGFNRMVAESMDRACPGSFQVEIVHRLVERRPPVATVNALRPVAAVELHANSATPQATGTEMIHFPGSSKGKFLAGCLQRRVVEGLGLPDRGTKTPWQGRGMGFLRGTICPAVVAEPFFISNPDDVHHVTMCGGPSALAWMYLRGLEDFLTSGGGA